MFLKYRLCDISLPESEFYHNMASFWSLFPWEKLVKKSLIQFKPCLHSAQKCHTWFVYESWIYLLFANIREICGDEYFIWNSISKMRDKWFQEISLEECNPVIARNGVTWRSMIQFLGLLRCTRNDRSIFLCQTQSILAHICREDLKLSFKFLCNRNRDNTTPRSNIDYCLDTWIISK